MLREVKELVLSHVASKWQSQESDPVLVPLFTLSVTPLNQGNASAAKSVSRVKEEKAGRLRQRVRWEGPTLEVRTDFYLFHLPW